jgi:hypothetical protein
LSGVIIGSSAGSAGSGTGSISIGANTLNGGSSNIYIGYQTGISAGNNNIFIGPGIASSVTVPSNASNTLVIGNGGTPTIIGDLAQHRIGINMSSLLDTNLQLSLDVNGYTRINNGYLGINKVPGDYTLDVNGSMQVSDGFGILRFTHDLAGSSTPGVSRTTITGIVNPGADPAAVGKATLQVSDGFFSTSGTTSSIPSGTGATIGVWKKGITMVTVQDATTSTNYASRIVSVLLTGTTYTLVSLVSSNSGTTTINQTGSTSEMVLSNASGGPLIYTYSITYFPTP